MNTQEKIDCYIENQLNPEDKKKFEEDMANDEALANEVQKRRFLHAKLSELLAYQTIQVNKDKNFKLSVAQNIQIEEDIISFHQNYNGYNPTDELTLNNILERSYASSLKPGQKNRYLWYKIAAGLAFLVVVSVSLLYLNNIIMSKRISLTSQRLTEIFPYENDLFLKDLFQSVTLFRHGYEMGLIETENQALDNNEKSRQILMLSDAITHLEALNLADARKRLEQLIRSDFQEIKLSSLWYYSLLCIKEGNTNEALNIVKQLSSEKSYYSERADSLIKLIKKE